MNKFKLNKREEDQKETKFIEIFWNPLQSGENWIGWKIPGISDQSDMNVNMNMNIWVRGRQISQLLEIPSSRGGRLLDSLHSFRSVCLKKNVLREVQCQAVHNSQITAGCRDGTLYIYIDKKSCPQKELRSWWLNWLT